MTKGQRQRSYGGQDIIRVKKNRWCGQVSFSPYLHRFIPTSLVTKLPSQGISHRKIRINRESAFTKLNAIRVPIFLNDESDLKQIDNNIGEPFGTNTNDLWGKSTTTTVVRTYASKKNNQVHKPTYSNTYHGFEFKQKGDKIEDRYPESSDGFSPAISNKFPDSTSILYSDIQNIKDIVQSPPSTMKFFDTPKTSIQSRISNDVQKEGMSKAKGKRGHMKKDETSSTYPKINENNNTKSIVNGVNNSDFSRFGGICSNDVSNEMKLEICDSDFFVTDFSADREPSKVCIMSEEEENIWNDPISPTYKSPSTSQHYDYTDNTELPSHEDENELTSHVSTLELPSRPVQPEYDSIQNINSSNDLKTEMNGSCFDKTDFCAESEPVSKVFIIPEEDKADDRKNQTSSTYKSPSTLQKYDHFDSIDKPSSDDEIHLTKYMDNIELQSSSVLSIFDNTIRTESIANGINTEIKDSGLDKDDSCIGKDPAKKICIMLEEDEANNFHDQKSTSTTECSDRNKNSKRVHGSKSSRKPTNTKTISKSHGVTSQSSIDHIQKNNLGRNKRFNPSKFHSEEEPKIGPKSLKSPSGYQKIYIIINGQRSEVFKVGDHGKELHDENTQHEEKAALGHSCSNISPNPIMHGDHIDTSSTATSISVNHNPSKNWNTNSKDIKDALKLLQPGHNTSLEKAKAFFDNLDTKQRLIIETVSNDEQRSKNPLYQKSLASNEKNILQKKKNNFIVNPESINGSISMHRPKNMEGNSPNSCIDLDNNLLNEKALFEVEINPHFDVKRKLFEEPCDDFNAKPPSPKKDGSKQFKYLTSPIGKKIEIKEIKSRYNKRSYGVSSKSTKSSLLNTSIEMKCSLDPKTQVTTNFDNPDARANQTPSDEVHLAINASSNEQCVKKDCLIGGVMSPKQKRGRPKKDPDSEPRLNEKELRFEIESKANENRVSSDDSSLTLTKSSLIEPQRQECDALQLIITPVRKRGCQRNNSNLPNPVATQNKIDHIMNKDQERLLSPIEQAKENMRNITKRGGQPVHKDDEWINVLEKMKFTGWRHVLGRGLQTDMYLLPNGSITGREHVDYLSSEYDAMCFALVHFGWNADADAKYAEEKNRRAYCTLGRRARSKPSRSLYLEDSKYEAKSGIYLDYASDQKTSIEESTANQTPGFEVSSVINESSNEQRKDKNDCLIGIFMSPKRKRGRLKKNSDSESRINEKELSSKIDDSFLTMTKTSSIEPPREKCDALQQNTMTPMQKRGRQRKNSNSTQLATQNKTNRITNNDQEGGLLSPIEQAKENMHNITKRGGQPVHKDDEWINVLEKMKFTGWRHVLGRGLQTDTYLLPNGSITGREHVDYLSSEYDAKCFASTHFGWNADADVKCVEEKNRRALGTPGRRARTKPPHESCISFNCSSKKNDQVESNNSSSSTKNSVSNQGSNNKKSNTGLSPNSCTEFPSKRYHGKTYGNSTSSGFRAKLRGRKKASTNVNHYVGKMDKNSSYSQLTHKSILMAKSFFNNLDAKQTLVIENVEN